MRILFTLGALAATTLLGSCTCSNCPSYNPEYLDDINVSTRSSFQ